MNTDPFRELKAHFAGLPQAALLTVLVAVLVYLIM